MRNNRVLLIFIKNPEKGKVKTRLAQTVGDQEAYETYLKLLDFTIEVANDVDAQKQIWYSSYIDEEDGLGGTGFKKRLQRGIDLGARMLNAFQTGFEESVDRIVIIGSDCPGISPEIIEQAFAGLDQNEVVIGPSEDGGYYLLGLRRLIPEIFQQISWSTDQVFTETVQILQNEGVNVGLLPTLNDIDTEEDLRKSGFE